jgi:hypothetical protein
VIAPKLGNKREVVKTTVLATFATKQAILLQNALKRVLLETQLALLVVKHDLLEVTQSQSDATTAAEITWPRIALNLQMVTATLVLLELPTPMVLHLAVPQRESSATTVATLDTFPRNAQS